MLGHGRSSNKLAFLSFFSLVLILGFQNCGSKVNFNPGMTAGPVDARGNPTAQSTPGDWVPGPTATPTPEASATPRPSANPSATPCTTPPIASSGPDLLCIIRGQGQSDRVGTDDAVEYLSDVHAIPHSVCMSAHACLDLINAYLNLTHGSFTTKPGQPENPVVQYTQQKYNSVCAHNPNVQHMTDEQIHAEIQKLMSR